MKLLLWLGILAAPFLGLLTGTWLTPVPVIVWDASSDHPVHQVLGFVDQGSMLLRLVADRDEANPGTICKMVVETLDATTGVCQQRLPVPEDLCCAWTREGYPQLTDDGSAILFVMHQQTEPPGNRIVLYDWRKQQVKRRFRADQYDIINRVMYCNGTLIARAIGMAGNLSKEYLLAWCADAVESSAMPFPAFEAFISADGSLVAVVSSDGKPLQILDVKKNRILQKLTGDFSGIRWLPGNQQFLAIVQDRNRFTSNAQLYTLQNDNFVPEQKQLILLQTPGVLRFAPKHLLARSHTMYENWRKELKSYLGEYIRSLVNIWWPEGSIRQLHDPNTGELLHRMILPPSFSRSGMTASPTSNTMATFDDTQITLWTYPTTGGYYPLIGLTLGIVLSALCFRYWLILHQRAVKSQPMMYLRRNMPQPVEVASDSITARDNAQGSIVAAGGTNHDVKSLSCLK